MVIENVMYFVLGLLVAGLLALMITPAVWNRAVRLTKKRIEAATPITMAEFRADKDQLRAEFALSTRRLEMNVEALRRRLADQLRDINRNRSELGGIKSERDQHLQVVQELEAREAELRRHNLELEKETADLAQKLRMRDREYAEKVSQLEEARTKLRGQATSLPAIDGRTLSGQYDADTGELIAMIEAERKRIGFLEEQNRALIAQLESSDRSTEEALATATELREQLAGGDSRPIIGDDKLAAAEARIADAESRVTTILAEADAAGGRAEPDLLLAERLTLEDELETLRQIVADMESAATADWDSGPDAAAMLRGRLDEIAGAVSRLVRALEGEDSPDDGEESLFDRVQRFIRQAETQQPDAARPPAEDPGPPDHAVSDRLRALRELQDGN
jgi:chromosome segregation ATPase